MLNCLLAHIAFQANHMAATRCIRTCGRDGDDLLKSKESIRIGKKGDLSDFDCGTQLLGARDVLVISCSSTGIVSLAEAGFTNHGPTKRKKKHIT